MLLTPSLGSRLVAVPLDESPRLARPLKRKLGNRKLTNENFTKKPKLTLEA